jgi:hypothetical protein
MVRRLLPPFLALLAACASAPPFEAPATPIAVKVPVYAPVYCDPPPLTHPALPIAALTPASPPADTMRAYAAAVAILEGAVKQREAVIAGCAAPSTSAAASPDASDPTVAPPARAVAPTPASAGLTSRVMNAARALITTVTHQ